MHLCSFEDVLLIGSMAQTRAVAEAIKARDFEKAMSLRDPEFSETLEGFVATSTLEKGQQLPENKARLPKIVLSCGLY
jgi:6-phosphofructokinase 1